MKIKETKLNIGDHVYVLHRNEIIKCTIQKIKISVNIECETVIVYEIGGWDDSCRIYYTANVSEDSINKTTCFTSKKLLLINKFGDCFEEKQCLK